MGEDALGIDDGDFANSGEFVKKRGQGHVEAGLGCKLSGERGQQQGKHAIQSVDFEFPVGPMVGGRPTKEVNVLDVFEDVLDLGEAAVGPNDVLGIVVGLYSEQQGLPQAFVGEFVKRGMVNGVVQRRNSFFLRYRALKEFSHELGG